MFCSNCGVKLEKEMKFCGSCGASVNDEVGAAVEVTKETSLEDQIELIFEGYWGVPAKKGAVVCFKDFIVLRPRGFDFLLGGSFLGALANRMLKQNDTKFHLNDAENDVYYLKDIEEISIKRRGKLVRDRIRIKLYDQDKEVEFFSAKLPEKFDALYDKLVTTE